MSFHQVGRFGGNAEEENAANQIYIALIYQKNAILGISLSEESAPTDHTCGHSASDAISNAVNTPRAA